MFFDARVLHVAKDSQFANEYEDAFHLDAARGIAAVADGVSSAIFSRQWADILVRAAVETPPNLYDGPAFQEWLVTQRARWAEQIDLPRLPWNQKQKLRQVGGAFATLLWVELDALEPSDEGVPLFRFRGFALGDSCLFHVRDGQVQRFFPLETAAEFELDPLSVCSADLNRDHLLEFRAIEENCQAGDLLVLCTDAVAKWAMTLLEAGQTPNWETYWDVAAEAWEAEIDELRRGQAMRRDDTTLVLLRIGPPAIVNESTVVSEPAEEPAADTDVVPPPPFPEFTEFHEEEPWELPAEQLGEPAAAVPDAASEAETAAEGELAPGANSSVLPEIETLTD